MIRLNPNDVVPHFEDDELVGIVETHMSFMRLFSSDDNMSYSLIIPQSKEETEMLMKDVPDNVNITGNYLEITFINDDSVKVVVVGESNVVPSVVEYLDRCSGSL